ncbi:rare lipoprotein A [Rhizobiales bacterium GAS188]|nr:rare lipoprotein A [Rhizobiales bacterium GAS188]
MNGAMSGINRAAPARSGLIVSNSVIWRSTSWAVVGRAVVGIGVSLMVANCASQQTAGNSGPGGIDPKYGVRASRRVYEDGEPIPKGGGQRLVGHAYSVAGRTYVPQDVTRYSVVGLASWYGSAFHGRLTANGEVFDRYSISAAHKTLPLPSYVRVTNIRNGRSIVVRVNDRGPYHANRVMDVSERVADVLDFRGMGTTQVQVDYLRPASIRGSDDRKLLATLRTDGNGAVLDGPGSVPVMVASADLTDAPQPSGPGAPIAAIASAMSSAVPSSRPAQSSVVAYNAPGSSSNSLTTITYSNGSSVASSKRAAAFAQPAAAQASDDDQPTEAVASTVVSNNMSARTTIAFAPLPPERPFALGVTTVAKTPRPGTVQPSIVQPSPAADGDEDEVIAPRPPVRPKQLATLFAPERLGDSEAFVPGNPFTGLKPQTFVRLRTP